jgi:hypothetical protein
MLKILKRHIFRPSQQLTFKDGKCLLMQARPDQNWSYNFITAGFFGTTGLLASNLLFGTHGVFRFVFTGIAFTGSFFLTKVWNEYLNTMVKQIYLLEDGKNIEIVHYGIMQNKVKIAIKELKDPETNPSIQIKMKTFNAWVVETNNRTFVVQPNNETFYPDVLKAVFKLQEIDVESQEEYFDIK